MALNRPPPSSHRAESARASRPLQSGSPATRETLGVGGDTGDRIAPRILIVMAEQWPRATLRAALREAGYDAVGTRSLPGALVHPARAEGRGPIRAIILDAAAVTPSPQDVEVADELAALLERQGKVPVLLLASAVRADPPGAWTHILRRPVSIQEIVAAVSTLVPLPPQLRGPIDKR